MAHPASLKTAQPAEQRGARAYGLLIFAEEIGKLIGAEYYRWSQKSCGTNDSSATDILPEQAQWC